MAVKARWPAGQVAPATGDPFEGITEGEGRELEDRRAQLARLIDRETVLLNRGITCPVRDRPDTSCCACPKRGRIPGLQVLCETGAQQERVVTELSCERLFDDA